MKAELREKGDFMCLRRRAVQGPFFKRPPPPRREMESRRVSKAARALLGKSLLQLMKSPRPDAL